MSTAERFTRADAVRIVEHVRDRLEKGWAPSAAIGLILHALRTYPAGADVLTAYRAISRTEGRAGDGEGR